MKVLSYILLFALLATPLALALPSTVAAQSGDSCLSRQEIQQRIRSGELRQLSDAMDAADVDGKIISSAARVCMVGGVLHWQINVMDSYGQSRPVILPAE